jgi:hypothetical protein
MQSRNRADRFGTKRNYNRTGRVARGIQRAFIAAGGHDRTTLELLEWSHPRPLFLGVSARARHYLCWDVRRAAERLCVRVGRSGKGSGRPVLWRLKTPTE